MTILDLMEWLPVAKTIPAGIESWMCSLGILPLVRKVKRDFDPLLVQEYAGFHLGITPDLRATSRHAARVLSARYAAWLESDEDPELTPFKNQYFTIAVGGGNTLKNNYKALLRFHFHDFDWLEHVRFFFLEETCNVENWEPARDSLVANFLKPLADRLLAVDGSRVLTKKLGLGSGASRQEIRSEIVKLMTFPIEVAGISSAMRRGGREAALERAQAEARRYQALLREHLGPSMSFHAILSGIGKDGGIGAFNPYAPQLRSKKAGVIALEKSNGAISVALNRGVLTAAEYISLIISGSLKLRALGRFEMEDSAPFEQTVMETPLRMLRESRDIAEKVYIFADDRALHFDEGVFRHTADGEQVEVKSEVREGDEEGGIHILLVHGFMGLYSYINLLIRLPSAWKVSALRRGKYAKTLPDEEIFPHYAGTLREIILSNWREGRPTPVCCHSMAGIIADHLLLSVLDDYDAPLPEFEDLDGDDRDLIEALRAAGVVVIATWAPSDTSHIRRNREHLKAHKKNTDIPLNFSGPAEIYATTPDGRLQLNQEQRDNMMTSPAAIEKLLNIPGTERAINSFNAIVRFLVGRVDLQSLMKQDSAPYGQRMLGGRVLKKVSFYGVLKEVNAAMHHPLGYQERHLKALDAIAKYDIPYLAIVHRDDFMVCANRHVQEHEYLLAIRLEKEGVKREKDLQVPARLVFLKGDKEEPEVELVDPHFLILSHSHEGGANARKVTAAMTEFVNENVARAIEGKQVGHLASVAGRRRAAGR